MVADLASQEVSFHRYELYGGTNNSVFEFLSKVVPFHMFRHLFIPLTFSHLQHGCIVSSGGHFFLSVDPYQSQTFTNMIGNFDNPLPMWSSDWYNFFRLGMAIAKLATRPCFPSNKRKKESSI